MKPTAQLILLGLVLGCVLADNETAPPKEDGVVEDVEATSEEIKEPEVPKEGETTTEKPKKPEPIVIDLNKPPDKSKLPDKTRLLFYIYDINTTTWLYEVKSGREHGIVTKIQATYSFDILHHDVKGNILARYRLLNCHAGPCHYHMPDVFVDFIQGGNNLEGLYVKLKPDEKPDWNLLFALVHSINTPAVSGAGDEQNVMTPYGLCHYRFGRPEDKRFRRRMQHCNFDGFRNHTMFPGVTVHKYEQDIIYIQNQKLDADMIFIDAEEKLLLSSPLSDKWNLHLETESHMEMMNRTRKYIKRKCPADSTAEDCAQTVFNATKLGSNWREIMKSFEMRRRQDTPQLKKLCGKYAKKLNDRKSPDVDGSLPNLFTRIVDAVIATPEEELGPIVEESKNNPRRSQIMSVIVDALAAAGTKEAHNVARKHLPDAPKHLAKYLQSLTMTTKLNADIIKDLTQWLTECSMEEDAVCMQVAFTLASLHRRHCESTLSRRNACNKDKEQGVKDFVDQITQCKDIKCHERALQVLLNLPLPSVGSYATKFLCQKDNQTRSAQRTALKILALVNTEFLTTPDIKKLVQIFRNACPLRQSTTDQTLASEVLLNAVPHHTSVGTYLLRSESLTPDNHDKWAYFYDNLALRRKANELVDEYWSQMRKFKVFRPNYGKQSLLASSNIFDVKITENDYRKLTALSKTEFNKGTFSRSDFTLDLSLPSARVKHLPLFGISIDTEGLESALSDSAADSDAAIGAAEKSDSAKLEASAQLSLMQNRLQSVYLFKDYSQLMSAVWNANGEKIDAYEANVMFRQYRSSIPLLSGLYAEMRLAGAASLDLDGSVQVSLWNRNAHATLTANVSMSLDGTVKLASASQRIGEVTTRAGAVTSVTTDFDVEFYSEPYLFCSVVGQGPLHMSHLYSRLENRERTNMKRARTYPAKCFALNDRTMQMCNHMAQKAS